MEKNLTLTIDGTAGSGKSTLGRLIGSRFNLRYVDSGAMYRAVGWAAAQRGLDESDEAAITHLSAELDIDLSTDPAVPGICVEGRDVTAEIRSPEASRGASVVAVIPAVRENINQRLRRLAAGGGLVMEGRDIGTVVLPHADLKIFLDANLEVRALRRLRENQQNGHESSSDQEARSIRERDTMDKMRKTAPLKPADDAIVIDTSNLSLEQVEDRIAGLVEKYRSGRMGK